MKIENKYILIQVNPIYEYDCFIASIGDPDDSPVSTYSMWSWINHLREKNWWNEEKEKQFKLLANKIINE